MNLIESLKLVKERIFAQFGKVKIGGTLARQSDGDLYPIAFANELNGGQHGYKNLEELANLSNACLSLPMTALIREHTLATGQVVPTTAYELFQLPDTGYDCIADLPAGQNDVSLYWRVFKPVAELIGTQQTQYAPNCDQLTGAATGDGSGSTPPFPGSGKGPKINHEQYSNLVAGQSVLIGALPVAGYWADTYDSTQNHVWMRQRPTAGANWGIPVKVSGEGYEQGDYIENRFRWYKPLTPEHAAVPATPAMYINGLLNNEPQDTFDTIPPDPGNGARLFLTKAQKTVFQQLKTPWMPYIEVKMDPKLVRYSPAGTPDPNTAIGADWAAKDAWLTAHDWLPVFQAENHKYMASRADENMQWVVTKILEESGEYTEYIFKAFSAEQMDELRDTPSSFRPERVAKPAGWSDTPPALQPGQAYAVSVARKYFNGELIGQWSDPYPFAGEDSLIDVIRSSGGDEFKYGKDGAITPELLTLTAYLYKGVSLVTADSVSWRRIFDIVLPDADMPLKPDGKSIDVTYQDVNGKAIFECTQEYGGLTLKQQYSVLDISDGLDAKLLELTSDAPFVTRLADGATMRPSNITLSALSANLGDEGNLKWFRKLPTQEAWTLILDGNGQPYTSLQDTLAVDYALFGQSNELNFKVESIDGLSDTCTIALLQEASNGAPAITMVLSNESHQVILDEATNTISYATAFTDVKIYEGATDVTGLWNFDIIDGNTAISTFGALGAARVASTSNNAKPRLQLTKISDAATTAVVTIKATRGVNTVQKHFKIAKIKDPLGAIILDIDADKNGFVFTPSAEGQTAKTLTAKLYVNSQLATAGVAYKWYIENDFDVNGNLKVQTTSNTLAITADQVDLALTLICEATYKQNTYRRVITLTDVQDSKSIGILYSKLDVKELPQNQRPNNAWAYNSAGGTVNGATWSKDATDAAWWSLRREGEANWSVPVRIKGEEGKQGTPGNSIRNVFQWASAKPAAPAANATPGQWVPAGWSDAPQPQPAGKNQLWEARAEITPDLKTVGAWVVIAQVNGTEGMPGQPGPAGNTPYHWTEAQTGGLNLETWGELIQGSGWTNGPKGKAGDLLLTANGNVLRWYLIEDWGPKNTRWEFTGINLRGPSGVPGAGDVVLKEYKPGNIISMTQTPDRSLTAQEVTNPYSFQRWFRLDAWGFAQSDSSVHDMVQFTLDTGANVGGKMVHPKYHILWGGFNANITIDATLYVLLNPGQSISVAPRMFNVMGGSSRIGNWWTMVIQAI